MEAPMVDIERTTTALLEGLFDHKNEAAWSQFDARYRPIVVAFARKLGLGESDANDVAQETVFQFLKEYREGKYDRDRGRLRSWIIGIARFRIAGIYRKKGVKREYRGESAMVTMPNEDECSKLWENERRTVILRMALHELRATTKSHDRTMKAFEMVAINQVRVATVANDLEMTQQEVYLAKSRTAKRLRTIIEKLDETYDENAT